jgi:hypothetical protein
MLCFILWQGYKAPLRRLKSSPYNKMKQRLPGNETAARTHRVALQKHVPVT